MNMIIVLYIIFSSAGLVMLKMGVSKNFSIEAANGGFSVQLNWILIAGVLVYLLAFITSLLAMKSTDLNFFYPVSAGDVYILVCIASFVFLKEVFTIRQMLGAGIILLGIVLINLK